MTGVKCRATSVAKNQSLIPGSKETTLLFSRVDGWSHLKEGTANKYLLEKLLIQATMLWRLRQSYVMPVLKWVEVGWTLGLHKSSKVPKIWKPSIPSHDPPRQKALPTLQESRLAPRWSGIWAIWFPRGWPRWPGPGKAAGTSYPPHYGSHTFPQPPRPKLSRPFLSYCRPMYVQKHYMNGMLLYRLIIPWGLMGQVRQS